MNSAEYKDWAQKIWGKSPYTVWSVIREERTVIQRKMSEDPIVRTLEWGGVWREAPSVVFVDKVIPDIQWLTLVVSYPTLVETYQVGHKTARQLVVPQAKITLDEQGYAQATQPERYLKLIERIKHVAGCGSGQARQLAKLTSGQTRLKSIEFAAYLLKRYASAESAESAVEQLWDYSPEVICSVIPPKFHDLVATGKHLKTKLQIQRCINRMASWWIEPTVS